MWYILLVGLTAQCLATRVTHHTTSSQAASSASSFAAEKNDWSWQDSAASASGQQDAFHPLSFSSPDAIQQPQDSQQQQYGANVQSGSNGAAQYTEQTVIT